MKLEFKKTNRLLLLSILCILHSGMVSAQAAWGVVGTKYQYLGAWKPLSGPYEGVTTVEVIRDTLLQGRECRVFEQTAGYVWWNGWDIPVTSFIFFEEDGQVYYHNQEADTFALLYDFRKVAGESWTVPVWSEWPDSFCPAFDALSVHVDSVSVEEINGQALKVQHVTITYSADEWQWHLSDKIYEGIGSATRMFFVRVDCSTHHYDIVELICVDHPDAGQLNFTDQPCPTTSTDGRPANLWQISLHPNPVTQQATVSCEGAFAMSVSDFSGRVLFQSTHAREVLEMDMSAYPAGVYVVRVTQGQRTSIQKIMKQ